MSGDEGASSDLYFGPAVSHVSYDVDVGSELERSDEWGYGAVLGLDVAIGEAGRTAGVEALLDGWLTSGLRCRL